MTLLEKALREKFGDDKVQTIPSSADAFPLLLVEMESRSTVRVLMTNGLSDYRMPVTPKYAGREHNELFFCLPSYWDLEDVDNPRFNWVFDWIQRLTKHILEKQTWFGVGHTISAGNPPVELSETMKQKHFIFSDPMLLHQELAPLTIEGKTIRFLAIVPIFDDEIDYKTGKGTYKFQQKLAQQNISEMLDDYRMTCLRSKWRFFKS